MAPNPYEPSPPSTPMWLDSFASTLGPYLGWPYPSWSMVITARHRRADDATDGEPRRRRARRR